MPKIFEIIDPFRGTLESHDVAEGATLLDWLTANRPELIAPESGVIAVLYTKEERFMPLREEWHRVKFEKDWCVHLVPRVAGIETIIIALVVAVVAVAVALSIQPPTPGGLAEPDPVYDNKGRRNQNKRGQPIEETFGSPRIYPSYASLPYNRFIGNDQFQYALLTLGHGEFDTAGASVQIDDTPVSNFPDSEVAFYGPSENPDLFPNNVVTSQEVGTIELFGPNQDEYVGPAGPYVVNEAGTAAHFIEIDYGFPQGLYRQNDEGKIRSVSVQVLFEYRAIDDDGDPLPGADWEVFADITKTLATNTPQRFTVGGEFAPDRAEFRARRVSDKNEDTKYVTTLQWFALRVFLPTVTDYGNVTLCAVKLKGSNVLNDNTSGSINIAGAVRKLPTWNKDNQEMTAPVATRNPVWAYVAKARQEHGGQLALSNLDLDFLADEALRADSLGLTFDWTYDQRVTLWEAAKVSLFIMRAIPMLTGTQLTLSRDSLQSFPNQLFTSSSMNRGSFSLSRKFKRLGDNDGLTVVYTDRDTWLERTMFCSVPFALGGDIPRNPKRLSLHGVTDRQKAWELGMYHAAIEYYERSVCNFTTGLEGHLPNHNSLVRVASDVPLWGQVGKLLDLTDEGVATLNEPVVFEDGEDHRIAFKDRYGAEEGPYSCAPGAAPNQVVITGEVEANFDLDMAREAPYFVFGVNTKLGKICRVVSIEPQGDDDVALELKVNDNRRFTFDGSAPPEIGEEETILSLPALPVVETLELSFFPNTRDRVLVAWQPALGAQSYEVQTRIDGSDWQHACTTTNDTNCAIDVVPGTVEVRVAASNLGQGPFVTETINVVEFVPSDVTGLSVQPAFTGLSARLRWLAATDATSYEVRIYTDATLRATREVSTLDYEYTFDEAEDVGGVARLITVEVFGKNAVGLSGNATSITITNPAPPILANATSELMQENSGSNDYRFSWTPSSATDVRTYRVYASATSGFTAGPSNIVFDGLASVADVRIDDSAATSIFWRVAAVDVWGDEMNLTAQQEIVLPV